MILRPAFKPTLLSLSNILKKQLTKSHPLKADQKGLLVPLNVQSLLSFDKPPPKLAFGVDVHPTRRACPASNDTCHACGKRGHWQQVCRPSSVKVVSDVEQDTHIDPHQPSYFITHDVCQVSSAPKGIFVDLDLSSSASSSVKHLKFQVDSGCSCNTMHVTDLNKLPPVPVKPSSIFL